jgi:hypothetical protein
VYPPSGQGATQVMSLLRFPRHNTKHCEQEKTSTLFNGHLADYFVNLLHIPGSYELFKIATTSTGKGISASGVLRFRPQDF